MKNANTHFNDMPIGIRNSWLDWANRHDWGVDAPSNHFNDQGELVTYCAAKNIGGEWFNEEAVHQTPQQLRDWAGY